MNPTAQDLQTIIKVYGYNPNEAKFFNVVDIVPKSLDWIWEALWDDCPFSMGDTIYTLASALDVKDWINNYIDENGENHLTKKGKKDLDKLNELLSICFDAQIYINVE
jgi:hypothetical protein